MDEHSPKGIRGIGVFCVEDLLKQSGGGLYALVRVAMLRSAELAAGKPALLDSSGSDKFITTAFEEILRGKIAVKKKTGQ